MSKISVKGVLVGGVTDIVATTILTIPTIIYVMAKLDWAHTPQDQVGAAITAAIHGNKSLYVFQLTIGIGCSVLGGYVAARLAKHDELLNGLLSTFLCAAIGVYALLAGKDSNSLLVQLLLLGVTPFFGLLGGYLRRAQKPARADG